MTAFHCEAILLRGVDYGESDRIVHLLTPEGGRLTAIAKAARRSHRRFPGTLDVFNRLEIRGRRRPRAALALLEQARLIDPFLGLRREAARYALASFLVELLDRMAPEGLAPDDAKRLFRFGVDALSLLASVGPDRVLRVLLELRALDALGIRPELGHCVRCGRAPSIRLPESHSVGFHVPDGGLVCSACGAGLGDPLRVTLWTLKRLRAGLDVVPSGLPQVHLDPRSLREAERLVFRFQRFHVGLELRSERFLSEIIPSSGWSAG